MNDATLLVPLISGVLFMMWIVWDQHDREVMRRHRRNHSREVCMHVADAFAKGLFYARLRRMMEEYDRDLRRSEYLWMKGFRGFMSQLEGDEE